MGDSAFLEPPDLGFENGTTPTAMVPAPANMTLKEARDRVELDLITNVLREHGGNIAKASQVLGVSRPTLYDLMKKHGMDQL